jgi:hypothetical protein
MLNSHGECVASTERPDAASWWLRSADVSTESNRITGVDIRPLPPGTALIVDTRHSSYRLVKLGGWDGKALVQGGTFFGEETEARIAGSTAGGNSIKIGWICIDLRLEILVGRRRFVTSPVRSIRIEPVNPAWIPLRVSA